MKRLIAEAELVELAKLADQIDDMDANWRGATDVATPQPQLFPYQAQQLRDLIEAYRWNRRVVELVSSEDSIVRPAYTRGNIVVVDGRTGKDACEKTAEACFDSLFDEADGWGSPSRLHITLNEQGIGLVVTLGAAVDR